MKQFFNGKISVKATFVLMLIAGLCVCACSCGVFILVLKKNAQPNEPETFSRLLEAAHLMEDNYYTDVDVDKMTDAAINAMVGTLGDQWSYYLSSEDALAYQERSSNSYVGIGVTVLKEDGRGLLIAAITEDSGAEDAGLSVGTYITAVDGDDISMLTVDEAAIIIKGEEGTSVTLTVETENGDSSDVSVMRKTVETDPVSSELRGSIGYIKIKNFNEHSADSFIEKVNQLVDSGAKGLVFDVRYNGGGRAVELCRMLDFLLPEGTIFLAHDKDGTQYISSSDPDFLDIPCTVLVNASSYSAAEYFAAVLQEYSYASIIGEHTVGKGFSQVPTVLSDGSVLSVSTQSYTTPGGVNLEGVGIAPDEEILLTDEESYLLYYGALEHENDPQYQAAEAALSKLISE